MELPEFVKRTLAVRLRSLRLRRQIARAAVEVRQSAEHGHLDWRVAQRLLRHLTVLDDELVGGERNS